MPTKLRNKTITLEIDSSNENYTGSRFDCTGKIAALSFKGRPVYGLEKLDPKETNDFGKAFYNEFGIDTALGFQEAEIGGWFHKIGVGMLKKKNNTYAFSDTYEIEPASFKEYHTADSIEVWCDAPLVNGYSYRFKKKIELSEKGFVVRYELINTGTKPLLTDEYCHNFLAIDTEDMGPNYTMKLPFQLAPEQFEEQVNPDGVVRFDRNTLSFSNTPKGDFFFSNLTLGKQESATWRLWNKKASLGIQETGNFKTDKINLWGCAHVISPELFYKINLQSGDSTKWTRQYELFEVL